jgi:anion-transporting  ArsA/GET3 family ATPase
MEEGFRLRAGHVRQLLADSSTAFVLVSAPRLDTVAEAGWFADRLEGAGLQVDALVVNRVHPVFWPDAETIPEIAEPGALQDLVANLRDLCEVNAREESTISELVSQVAPAPVVMVPLLDADVHDLEGLEMVADSLFGQE